MRLASVTRKMSSSVDLLRLYYGVSRKDKSFG